MATTIPLWLLGQHVTTLTVTAQSVDSAGLFSDLVGYSFALVAFVDEITYSGRRTTESIVPLTSTRDNEVVIEQDDTITLGEIMRTDDSTILGSQFTMLTALFMKSGKQNVKVLFTRGGNSITYYGVMQNYREVIRKGKSVAMMNLQIVDFPDATANPAYS